MQVTLSTRKMMLYKMWNELLPHTIQYVSFGMDVNVLGLVQCFWSHEEPRTSCNPFLGWTIHSAPSPSQSCSRINAWPAPWYREEKLSVGWQFSEQKQDSEVRLKNSIHQGRKGIGLQKDTENKCQFFSLNF